MRALALIGCAALALSVVGCGDSESAQSGAREALRVSNGQFFPGDLPAANGGPAIDGPDGVRNTVVAAGFTGKKIAGLAPLGSYAVAMTFKDLDQGYWVVPVGSPDPLTGELSYSANCDFSRDIPAGDHQMSLAAIDTGGHFGRALGLNFTMLPFVPDGSVVARLEWNNDADVDLHIVGPSGKELDPKHPNSGTLDKDGNAPAGSGTLDRDSNANCVADGYRSEDVVWTDNPDTTEVETPGPGTYVVRADMFNACGRPATTFVFKLFVGGELVKQQAGRLLDIDADGGGPGSGLFVTEFTL